ncbi:unnamed protein product [Camellia sinensis]
MRDGIGIRRRVDDGRLRIVVFDYRCRALEAVMAERESCSRDSSVRALSGSEIHRTDPIDDFYVFFL